MYPVKVKDYTRLGGWLALREGARSGAGTGFEGLHVMCVWIICGWGIYNRGVEGREAFRRTFRFAKFAR